LSSFPRNYIYTIVLLLFLYIMLHLTWKWQAGLHPTRSSRVMLPVSSMAAGVVAGSGAGARSECEVE